MGITIKWKSVIPEYNIVEGNSSTWDVLKDAFSLNLQDNKILLGQEDKERLNGMSMYDANLHCLIEALEDYNQIEVYAEW